MSSLFSIYKPYPKLKAILSGRRDGSMRFLGDGKKAQRRRNGFLKHENLTASHAVFAGLAHGSEVATVISPNAGRTISAVDALVTRERDLPLVISVADCLPVFFFDPEAGGVGIAHAGRRGLEAKVITHTIEKLVGDCGARAAKLLVGIGPGVGPCHYSVDKKTAEPFSGIAGAVTNRGGVTFLDLKRVAEEECLRNGILLPHLETSSLCTFCEAERFFSRRREGPDDFGTMLAAIARLG